MVPSRVRAFDPVRSHFQTDADGAACLRARLESSKLLLLRLADLAIAMALLIFFKELWDGHEKEGEEGDD